MPITVPKLDERRYDDLVSEALARIPVHTPEWTNFNRSDPGVTLVELFAFLTESLLYRANLIPERNLAKFLQLLRIPLNTALASRGLITISNDAPSATPQPVVISEGLEVRAGQVPFRTTRAVDVLPVEGRLYVKKRIEKPSEAVTTYYKQLYASYRGPAPDLNVELYEAVPFPTRDGSPLSLDETGDKAFWLALLVRNADARAVKPEDLPATRDNLRRTIANRTLTLGVVPSQSATEATLAAGRRFGARSSVTLNAFVPRLDEDGGLPAAGGTTPRRAAYQPIPTRSDVDVFSVVGTVEVSLPDEAQMRLWNNLDPLEAGVDTLPPSIDDETVAGRVVTWIKLAPSAATSASFRWMGINAVGITQRARVEGELLPQGTGEPDQTAKLALAPVLPDSVRIIVTPQRGTAREWTRIDDLAVAPPEVPLADPNAPAVSRNAGTPFVFELDAESGEVRFGDGHHGARPPDGAIVRATYDYALGAEGNVGQGTIKTATASLPDGFSVINPIATWGGSDAETVAEGTKQISHYLQNRNRLVTASDFRALTLRTPGVDVARVEVLANYDPQRGTEAPGVVTLMLIPAYDPDQPDAPLPRTPFIEAVCRQLDPRRLITTEIRLRGPEYVGIWISIGVKVDAGFNESQVTEAVKQDIVKFLAPFTSGGREQLPDTEQVVLGTSPPQSNGWKLTKAVVKPELLAVANRTPGVEFARNDAILATADGSSLESVPMTGLQLPRILGIRITNGPAAPLSALMGGTAGDGTSTGTGTGDGSTGGDGTTGTGPRTVQVPVIPEECRC